MTIYEGRPENCAGRSAREIRTYDKLDSLGISYKRTDHNRARTMNELHTVDLTLDVAICKNLFLSNRAGTVYYMLMIPAAKGFRSREIASQLGVSRLSFGTEDDMVRLLDVHPGSVSIMALMNDTEGRVTLLMDEDIAGSEYIGCHPCENTTSLKIKTADILNVFLPATGHTPIMVKVETKA